MTTNQTSGSNDFDLGPLTWVQGEIDLALARASEALKQVEQGDTGALRFAQTHLHQARGALSIVGLDGLTQFCETVEQLMSELAERADANLHLDLLNRCLTAVRQFLEGLMAGGANQSMQLLPLYRELQDVRGQSNVMASDLFFPDLSVRPDIKVNNPKPLPPTEMAQLLRKERLRFERGLLEWLRNPQQPEGLVKMRDAVQCIEDAQGAASARSFWWITHGLIEGLARGSIEPDFYVKRLFARIDLQMRRLLDGSRTVAERVMRDALYLVATAMPGGERLEEVRSAYRLDNLLPPSHASGDDNAPLLNQLRGMREATAAAKDAWNRFTAGAAIALPQFEDAAVSLQQRATELADPDVGGLCQSIANVAQSLRRDPLQNNETLAMEMATGLLVLEEALEHFGQKQFDLHAQVDTMLKRLTAASKGEPVAELESPRLGEMSRRAQERLFMSHVAREIQNNLADVERALDSYFRGTDKDVTWDSVSASIRQVQGALTILNQDRAREVLNETSSLIQCVLAPGVEQNTEQYERIAHQLSALGFFVNAIQHGPSDIDAILNPRPVAVELEEGGFDTVEQELAQVARDTQALAAAIQDSPQDDHLRQELKQNLETMRQDAQLVADIGLETRIDSALAALDDTPHNELAAAMAELTATQVGAAIEGPSEETLRLAEASSEELDAELLEIFLEEAHEVLATIEAHLGQLRDQPHDQAVLTTIRRGFHTLKGSGRMVGLRDLGETAWSVEQVMNKWLQQEQDATLELISLIERAHSLFADWVMQIENGGSAVKDSSDVVRSANELLDGHSGQAPVPNTQYANLMATVIPSPNAEQPFTVLPSGNEHLLDPTEIVSLDDDFGDEDEIRADMQADHLLRDMSRTVVPGASDDELLAMYVEEARIYLVALGEEKVRLQNGGVPDEEAVRVAHTLSGCSSAIGFLDVRDLARALEHALSRHAEMGRTFSRTGRQQMGEAVQALATMVDVIAEHGITPGRADLVEQLDSLQPGDESFDAPDTLTDDVPDAPVVAPLIAPTHAANEALNDASHELDEIEVELTQQPSPHDDEAALDLGNLSQVVPAESAALASVAVEQITSPELPIVSQTLPSSTTLDTSRERNVTLTAVDEIDAQLLPIFLEEAHELMQQIGDELRSWHSQPDDLASVPTLQRLFHTLKGSARMAGAMRLGEHLHAMESRLAQAGALQLAGTGVLEELDVDTDTAALMLDKLSRGESVEDIQPEALQVQPDIASPAMAAAPVRITAPAAVQAAEPAEGEQEGAQQRATVRVRADMVDRFVNEAGEMNIARTRVEGELRTLRGSLLELTENVIRLRNQLREIEIQAESQMASRQAEAEARHEKFDPLEFDRFTRFQEVTRMMAESVGDVTTIQQNLLKNLDEADSALNSQGRLNRELSQALMSVRLVPFSSLTDRLFRVARQSAKELNKKVALDIRNGQVELDRDVLEKITGPLEHLLRNAVAHGIESRESRAAAGKVDTGEILFSLAQEGNEVRIDLSDDGGGLNFERIRARAIERGLIEADAQPTERELTALIFEPGFSTAEELSEVAGRGVGMDVVRSEVTALGGRVEVTTVTGKGSHFAVVLPMTLAIAPSVLVKCGNKTYAIPASMVKQVQELKPAKALEIRQQAGATWMDQHFPYRYLPFLLGENEARPDPLSNTWLLYLRAGTEQMALEVDQMSGNQEVVVKLIGAQLSRLPGVSGATVLGDGEIVLIINPVALMDRAVRVDVPDQPARPQTPRARQAVIMVVDDSLTVRKISSRMLEREGYRVMTAKDGVDALENLIEVVPDVMLLDIEMPRMDGFDLTRNIRADERLKHLPIIMITSRTADKHRNYAMEIGVDHYLGKPYDEDQLLMLISRYAKPN